MCDHSEDKKIHQILSIKTEYLYMCECGRMINKFIIRDNKSCGEVLEPSDLNYIIEQEIENRLDDYRKRIKRVL